MKRARVLAFGLATSLAGAGCLGVPVAEKQQFTLVSQRRGAPSPSCRCSLHVGHIRVAPLFERKRFVYRTGRATWSDDPRNVFRSPPGTLLRGSVVDWMEASALFTRVLDPRHAGDADWILEGVVTKFYGDVREEATTRATLEVEFTLLEGRTRRPALVFQRVYGASLRAIERDPPAIAAAWSASLERILDRLEADLRDHVGGVEAAE